MKWYIATAVLLLVPVATASAAAREDDVWGSYLTSWSEGLVQRVGQSVNEIRRQANTARDVIEQQLQAFNSTLRVNNDLIDRLLPPDTAHTVNKSLNNFFDMVNCVFQQGCRLVPSTAGSRRTRRDLAIAQSHIQSSLSPAELQQARSFLNFAGGRVRRQVLTNTADLTDKISSEINSMLARTQKGIQQVRDNVETFRIRVNSHINDEAEKTRVLLRCWFALVCPTSASRSARSADAVTHPDDGAAMARRLLGRFDLFDSRIVGEFLTSLFNSNTAADVDVAVNRVRDSIIEKTNQFACLLTLSCRVAAEGSQ